MATADRNDAIAHLSVDALQEIHIADEKVGENAYALRSPNCGRTANEV